MPSNQKVGFAKLKVGLLGLVALFFIALLVFLLTSDTSWFQKEVPLHAYVSDAAGLTAGAPVRINGIQAGSVKNVQLSGETNPQKVIKVDLVVDEPLLKQIPSDSIAAIGSDNLLGSTKFFQINKGSSHEPIRAGATIKTANTQEFQQLVAQGFGVLDSAQAILQRLQDIIGQIEVGKGTIGKLLVDESLYNSLVATVTQV
ncbi:MAG: MlaD family protein, partial [Bryobacteraceae bacterium]